MKIAIIGAGAVGSVIGGLLFKAGEDVTLIGRKSHVDAINQSGLILEGESGKSVIQIKAAENLDFKPDLALLTVKAQDVASSIRKIRALLSGIQVVTTQNGVHSDDEVADLLRKENIISIVVLFNGEFLEPGKVSYSTRPRKAQSRALALSRRMYPTRLWKIRPPECFGLPKKSLILV